jgi:hypothetical protein
MPGLILQHWLSPMGSNAVGLAKARLVDAQLNSREAAGIARQPSSPQTEPAPAAFLDSPAATRNRRLTVRGASSGVTFSCHVCCSKSRR